MAISVSGRKLAIATGALTGGYISDDEGFGTLYGAAVGAYVGSEFNPIKPDIKKFMRKTFRGWETTNRKRIITRKTFKSLQ